jgi:hypothetical protein
LPYSCDLLVLCVITLVENFKFFQLISSNLITNYEELNKNQPELFMDFSIDEIQMVNENLKRIKPDENEEEHWRDFENSNMLGERNEVESLRAELPTYLGGNRAKRDFTIHLLVPKERSIGKKILAPLYLSA